LRVPPIVLTFVGAALAITAVPLATAAPIGALGCVLGAALCDALDGAVAVLTNRATRFGAWADAIADRVADWAFAVVLWRCGAPWELALVAGVLSMARELYRIKVPRARSIITVDERPTRVICTGVALLAAASTSADWAATVCAAVWVVLATAGWLQFRQFRKLTVSR
ncbi:MAG: CDP-alcohol phosphatidyltransferase family protein, partial [Chloroflexi bacterium]|nr:CDP-alcohol phosphatidyltransferase family protein [Chloroflexota bacterium]